jgi:protein TonB
MLFLAALIHGVLIIGITFSAELGAPFSSAISLEVTIVANPDQQIDRPDDAAYLAQASQQGAGNTTQTIRPSAPLRSAMPVNNRGREDGAALRDTQAHERTADNLLTTRDSSDRRLQVDPRTQPEDNIRVALAMEAGVQVTLPLPQENDANLLLSDSQIRQLIISADTRESVVAAYLNTWKRRIEAVGADYLPQLQDLDNITGSPTLLVTIAASGDLTNTAVSKSSGSTLLDLASLDIIQRASPFDSFPTSMAAEYDSVAFEYKFLFADRNAPVGKSSER